MTDNTPDAPAVALLPCPNPWCESMLAPFVTDWSKCGPSDEFQTHCGCGICAPSCATEAEAIAAWNTRPPATLPSEDDAKRVALAIAKDIDRQDYDSWTPEDDWDFTMPYLDQGEVNYLEVARVAIAAMAPEQIAKQEPQ